MKSLLLVLFNIAFKTRASLPMILASGFLLLDFRLRLEVGIDAHFANHNQQQQAPEQRARHNPALNREE